MDAKKQVLTFGVVVFLLLSVLFGVILMSYIFGNIAKVDLFTDDSHSVTNETNAWVNGTTYTVDYATSDGFGSMVVTSIINASSNVTIGSGNYTVGSSGTIVGTAGRTENYSNVLVSYTYTDYSDAEIMANTIDDDSLYAITRYTGQSDTQFLVVGIAITLLILIALFVVFWKYFMMDVTNKMSGDSRNKNFG